MKGTLFSADFIKDSSNNLRLLELNTDTTIVPEQVDDINWTPFINILTSSSISDLHVIYKPVIHKEVVNALSSSFSTAVSGSSFTRHPEDKNTIYPSSVTDGSDRFILRLAYDESALFDSDYCKNRLNVYKLYHSGSSDSMITQFYYSSSNELFNTLDYEINTHTIPDATIKDIDESFNPIDFHKIGSSSLSNEERWNGFLTESKASDKLIEQYHYHSSSLDSSNRLLSYRTFYVVYDTDLKQLNLHSYVNSAIFDVTENLTASYDDTSFTNKVADHHYYEYTTNSPKVDGNGLLSTDKIQMADDTYSTLADINVGDRIKSFFISGSPQVESDYSLMNWQVTGSSFPSGSYVTSSEVVFKNTEDLYYNALVEYKVDGDSQFSGTSKQFLVYDSGSDITKYKHSVELDVDNDYFFKADGTLVDLDEVNYYITTDTNVQVVELDVEDTDTYILSGSTAFNAVVSHNNPCFVAGTSITMANGTTKNIENVVIGDEVQSYNIEVSKIENKIVRGLTHSKIHETIRYTFDDGSTLRCTWDHPIWCTNKETWISKAFEDSHNKYQINVVKAEIGDTVQKVDGTTTNITNIELVSGGVEVYNLNNIDTHHNYFADGKLVHNRCFVAGTQISMFDGTTKNIEDVQIEDEVTSFNEETGFKEGGIVNQLSETNVPSVMRIVFEDDTMIKCTGSHPFFVKNKGWTRAVELSADDVCKTVENSDNTIVSVEIEDGEVIVYNLLNVTDAHNFYANGILVHNK